MEPITVGIIIGIVGFIGAAVAVIFWQKILDWAEKSLFPWLKKNLPTIEPLVREAFVAVDKVAAPIRGVVKQAWKKLREHLLKQTVELERNSSGEWIKRGTSWVVKVLESDETKPSISKVETEEKVAWEELPDDVRAEFLRREKKEAEFNVTEMRDKELMEMTA